MVKKHQVRDLMKALGKGKTLAEAAAKAGMSENTARKWRDLGRYPGDVATERTHRTREDPFCWAWGEVKEMLEINPGLEGKTLFEYLQTKYPGEFADGQLRTLQRRIKVWRATEGPPKEIFFAQVHVPGVLSESDFTCMNDLGITIAGAPFEHELYHFVLTYSNWEHVTICLSENFQAFSEGFQNAAWALGGITRGHRTDWLSTAIHNDVAKRGEFTQNYDALLAHYRVGGFKIQPGEPHENGDVEQAHNRLKRALDQALMLRGSRDFASLEEYRSFLEGVVGQLNSGRAEQFEEERKTLKSLPLKRLESVERLDVRVSSGATIRVKRNTYSVDSRLRGEAVTSRVYMDHIEVWYAQRCVDRFPRLRGEGKHRINYRHVIDILVRKPGAFANYRYRDDLFPTVRFRMAYDWLRRRKSAKAADREYLEILQLAAMESEAGVDACLALLFDLDAGIDAATVGELVKLELRIAAPEEVTVDEVDLASYDQLLLPGVNE